MIVAIVQARLGSIRLPGKVMADICGKPMLMRVVERIRRAETINKVVVATSDLEANNEIRSFCSANDIDCFSGSENDVLDRFYRAAMASSATAVARITADCPLIDPVIVDRVIARFMQADCDYASNVAPPTFPDGLDCEIFSVDALRRSWREAHKKNEREHVTVYLRTSGLFRTANVANLQRPGATGLRWTVDDSADLEFVRRLFQHFAAVEIFGMDEVLDAMEKHADLRRSDPGAIMNQGYYKSLYACATAGAAPARPMEASQAWLARAAKVIPGCAQTFSKGGSQYVRGVSPVFLARGKGCRVWDVDGNEYIDYVQGLLPNILGYANDEVNAAVTASLRDGNSFSLPHPLEVQLAERIVDLFPCAEMVRFGKNGSDATAGAVRAARAYTGRDRIACCGYHGWQDWFIGSTARNAGVPAAVRALTHPFPYNDLAALEHLLDSHPGEFAAVIMEPFNFTNPLPGFLEGVKERIHRAGGLLVFDEICSGFHFGLGGAQKKFGVIPDMACLGKAMANGFPLACIAGRADVMKIFEEIFVSFTFGGETASFAAALKVLDILETTDALQNIESNGTRLQDGFNALAAEAGLASRLRCVGHPSWSLLRFLDESGSDSFLVRSLFQQEAVKRGLLQLVTHNMSAAHDVVSTEQTLEVYAAVMKTLAGWLPEADPGRHLAGPVIQPVFRVR